MSTSLAKSNPLFPVGTNVTLKSSARVWQVWDVVVEKDPNTCSLYRVYRIWSTRKNGSTEYLDVRARQIKGTVK